MKLLASISLIATAYNYPLHFVIIAIAFTFLLYVIKRDLEIYSFKPSTITPVCVEIDWTKFSYKEIQSFCKSNGIKKINRKKQILIQQLESLI